jgi:HK97 family phage major capsid protein
MSYLDSPKPEASEELKKLGGEVRNALTALKEATEAKSQDTLEKVSTFFKKYEDENSRLVKQVTDFTKAEVELKEKVAAAEKEIAQFKAGTADYDKRVKDLELLIATKTASDAIEPEQRKREVPEYKNFFSWLTSSKRRGEDINIDFKTLRTDSESAGGYLIPQVMDNQIRKNIIEISPIRAHARVRTSPSKTMDIPRRLSIPIAQFEGEAEAAPTDQSVYGSEQVTLYRQTVKIPATLDMMVSSAFDLEREIAADVGESFAQGEGKNFVNGNGRKSPQGFITDGRCVAYQTANTAAIVWSDFANLAGALKRGQAPWFFMNRKTVAYVQSLQSTIGVPIWQPVAGNQPATIYGYPYDSNVIDLDDVSTGTGAKPVVFADLMRGYEIFDMIGINVIRDDLTQADKAITQWIFRRYLTGRVILPEAIGIMTLK